MDTTSRKRHSTDSSLELPVPKKKKKLSKTTVSVTPVVPENSPKKKSKSGAKEVNGSSKKTSRRREPSEATITSSSTEETRPGATASSSADPKPKRARKPKAFYARPVNGSWTPHLGSLLMYRCVSQALLHSIDPRQADSSFDWSVLSSGVLSTKDLELVWTLIKNEFPDQTLDQIKDELKPSSTLTVDEANRAAVKDKFKAEYPKMPVTPYMLFVQSKSASVKAKHPTITQTEVAKKLGKKWRSFSAEQKEVYKQKYLKLKTDYESKLEAFYDEHPGAKKPVKKAKVKQLTVEEKRIKELKAALPVPPVVPYILFCKAKRQKAQDKHPELSAKEITKKLSLKWKSMTELDKSKYKDYYDEAKKSYKQKLKLFHETYPDAKELLPKSAKGLEAETKANPSLHDEDADSCWDSDSVISVTEDKPINPPPAPSLSPEKSREESHDTSDDLEESSDTSSSTELED